MKEKKNRQKFEHNPPRPSYEIEIEIEKSDAGLDPSLACGAFGNIMDHPSMFKMKIGQSTSPVHRLYTALQIVPLFAQKMGRKFPCTLTTKCVNISVSTQPFLTK